MEAAGGLRTDEQFQALNDAGDPQVVVVLPGQPPACVAVELKHAVGGLLEGVCGSWIGPDRSDLGRGQDRGIGLSTTAGRQRKQPLNVVVCVLELLISPSEHVGGRPATAVAPISGEIGVQRSGCNIGQSKILSNFRKGWKENQSRLSPQGKIYA